MGNKLVRQGLANRVARQFAAAQILDAEAAALNGDGEREPGQAVGQPRRERQRALLVPHPATPGGTLHIPAGLVHAIGAGCLVYEVQQSANTTYRLHDWNRVDASGRPRPLHVEESLAAIDWSLPVPRVEPPRETPDAWQTCSATADFTLRRARLTRAQRLGPAGESFHALFVAEGAGELQAGTYCEPLAAGESLLVPACVADYTFAPRAPGATLLVTTL